MFTNLTLEHLRRPNLCRAVETRHVLGEVLSVPVGVAAVQARVQGAGSSVSQFVGRKIVLLTEAPAAFAATMLRCTVAAFVSR